ncbi:MAG: ferric reductase-like transmembrane domain-containing protein [Mesorhizobium sp.]|nr:ferric reductase-like transmembrane domain-containing protein [Mesorhizobium sp.]
MLMPIMIAAASPFLAYRNATYIAGGFAGIICLALFVIQPLLAAGYLPGSHVLQQRRWHRWAGSAIIACVLLHVGLLFVTSPVDTLDALLLVAPTPFSIYGVAAMWGVALTALLVALRRRLGLRYPIWHFIHNGVALMVVIATVIHAVQIEGAMGTLSKWALCIVALLATGLTLLDQRAIRPFLLRARAKGSTLGGH